MLRIRTLGLVAILVVTVLLLALSPIGPWGDRSAPPTREPADRAAAGTGSRPTTPGAGTEVLPRQDPGPGAAAAPGENLAAGEDVGSARALPGLDAADPGRTEQGALVAQPLPRSAVSRAGLVAGYPTSALPPVPATRVRTSSVSASGGRLQVALVATSERDPDGVTLFYRQSLARLGFTEVRVAAPAGGTAVGFRRGRDTVSVTTTSAGRATTYSLLGTLHAGKR